VYWEKEKEEKEGGRVGRVEGQRKKRITKIFERINN